MYILVISGETVKMLLGLLYFKCASNTFKKYLITLVRETITDTISFKDSANLINKCLSTTKEHISDLALSVGLRDTKKTGNEGNLKYGGLSRLSKLTYFRMMSLRIRPID